MNNYLAPMVNDLLSLWKGININMPQTILGSKLIQAGLCYISSDLPATRKLCGVYGYHATYSCSKMSQTISNIFTTSPDYSGFDRSLWQAQSCELHCRLVKSAVSRTSRQKTEQEAGIHYSDLLRLYLAIVQCHLVETMHNLFLGMSKRILFLWKDRGFLNNSAFEKIQFHCSTITRWSHSFQTFSWLCRFHCRTVGTGLLYTLRLHCMIICLLNITHSGVCIQRLARLCASPMFK